MSLVLSRSRRLAAVALIFPLALLVIALAIALGSEHRVVARLDLHASPTHVEVDCGFLGESTRRDWGEAASRRCEPVLTGRLQRAGLIAVVGGTAGVVLTGLLRRRHRTGRLAQRLSVAVAAIGVPSVLFGTLLDSSSSTVTPLVVDAGEVLDVVGRGRVVTAFETIELRQAQGGLRANEELWIVVRTDIADVRAALGAHDWPTTDLAQQFSEGWVTARSTAPPDVVDVGAFAAVTGETADTGRNARRLLAGIERSSELSVVRVRPPLVADR